MLSAIFRKIVSFVILKICNVQVEYCLEKMHRLMEGRAILISNHVSFIDGIIVALASPIPLTFAVESSFAKVNNVTKIGLKMLEHLGFGIVVPIDSDSPFSIRTLLSTLESGKVVMIFPEGRISYDGKPLPMQPGVKWLSDRSGSLIIEAKIEGAHRSCIFGKSGNEIRPQIKLTL